MKAQIESQLDDEIKVYQDYQKDLSGLITSRSQLDSQIQENQMVQKEFKILSKDAQIYKQIGPALIKQDRVDAVTNVDKRIEFISSELKRLDASIKDIETKSEKKKIQIVGLQTTLQQKDTKE